MVRGVSTRVGVLKTFFQGPESKTEAFLTRAGPVAGARGFYSYPGPPLAEAGRAALVALFKRLRGAPVAHVYASDARAETEAARLAALILGVPYTLDPRLRDRAWGDWEGVPFARVREASPELVRRWAEDEASFRPPGGESVLDVWARSQPLLRSLLARHRGAGFLLVGNCTVNRALLALALPFLPPEAGLRLEQDEARLTHLVFYDDVGVIKALNR